MWQPLAQRDGANNNLSWPPRGSDVASYSLVCLEFSNVPKWNPWNYRCERSRTLHQNYFGSLTQFLARWQLEWRKWEASQACWRKAAGSETKTERERDGQLKSSTHFSSTLPSGAFSTTSTDKTMGGQGLKLPWHFPRSDEQHGCGNKKIEAVWNYEWFPVPLINILT